MYSTTSATNPLNVAATATPLTRMMRFLFPHANACNLHERTFNKGLVKTGGRPSLRSLDSRTVADGD